MVEESADGLPTGRTIVSEPLTLTQIAQFTPIGVIITLMAMWVRWERVSYVNERAEHEALTAREEREIVVATQMKSLVDQAKEWDTRQKETAVGVKKLVDQHAPVDDQGVPVWYGQNKTLVAAIKDMTDTMRSLERRLAINGRQTP